MKLKRQVELWQLRIVPGRADVATSCVKSLFDGFSNRVLIFVNRLNTVLIPGWRSLRLIVEQAEIVGRFAI